MNEGLRLYSAEFESGKISVFEYRQFLLGITESLSEMELRHLATAIGNHDNDDVVLLGD